MTNLVAKTTEIILKNTVETISNKINTAKKDYNKDKTIVALENIINDLLADKAELNRIIKRYEEILSVQKISDDDISYITNHIIPLFKELFESDIINEDDKIKTNEVNKIIEFLEPLLSVHTLKILQLLGFNFKEAIGTPLTELIKRSINNKNCENLNAHYAIAIAEKEKELFKLLQVDEGRKMYRDIIKSN